MHACTNGSASLDAIARATLRMQLHVPPPPLTGDSPPHRTLRYMELLGENHALGRASKTLYSASRVLPFWLVASQLGSWL